MSASSETSRSANAATDPSADSPDFTEQVFSARGLSLQRSPEDGFSLQDITAQSVTAQDDTATDDTDTEDAVSEAPRRDPLIQHESARHELKNAYVLSPQHSESHEHSRLHSSQINALAQDSALAPPQQRRLDHLAASRCWIVADSNHSLRDSTGPKRMRMEAMATSVPLAKSGEQARTDHETLASIYRKLHEKLNRSARRIRCRVERGHVEMHGRVRSFYEMQLAQEAALRTRGVQSVLNHIEVDDDDFR